MAALLLQPVLDEPATLRLVATGTGSEVVEWHLDGERVAVTADGEPFTVNASAGPHDLWAVTAHDGSWNALVRPDGVVPGAHHVHAWTANHAGAAKDWNPLPLALGTLALAMFVGRRRPKRP